MRAKSKLLALALMAALQPAVAGVVPLTFEDVKATTGNNGNDGYVELLDRYIDKGIVFSGDAWAVVRGPVLGPCGGVSSFIPRDGGCAALLLNGDEFKLNFSEGFVAGSSLYYSALPDGGVTITLFEGENGTGERKSFANKLTEADCGGGAKFCNWDLLTFDFKGTARSMVVTGQGESLMMDDFSFVQAGPTDPGTLPEPASLALAFSALSALAWARKRTAR